MKYKNSIACALLTGIVVVALACQKKKENNPTSSGGDVVNSQKNLTVSASGTGVGTITGTGIDCGSDCAENYAAGTEVTLKANPDGFSKFDGWSGSCSGTGDCLVKINDTAAVVANFQKIPLDGTWSGTTSQAFPISFVVSGEKIQSLTYKIHINGSECNVTYSISTSFSGGRDIVSKGFNTYTSGGVFQGLFTSAYGANGTLHEDEYTYCYGSEDVTWSTNRPQGLPAPAIAPALAIGATNMTGVEVVRGPGYVKTIRRE